MFMCSSAVQVLLCRASKQILRAKCKVWAHKRCSKICSKDYHLLKKNDAKYFCQPCARKTAPPSSNKANDPLSNSKSNDDAPDNTISNNSNKN